jgi:hypothetical protein
MNYKPIPLMHQSTQPSHLWPVIPRAHISIADLYCEDKTNQTIGYLSSMFVIAWADCKLIDAVFLRHKVSLIVKSSITVNPLSVTLASRPI